MITEKKEIEMEKKRDQDQGKENIKTWLLKAGRPDLAQLLDAPEGAITWGQMRDIVTAITLADAAEKAVAQLLSDLITGVFRAIEAKARARGEPLDPSCAVTKELVGLLAEGLHEAAEELEKFCKTVSPPATTKYLETLSSHLYHSLRSAYAARKFSLPEGERWPAADLSGAKKRLRALAQLRPDPKEVEPYLSADELAAWQKKMAEHVMAMDDVTADVLDIISAAWLREAEHPEAMVTITADEFLRYRGLRPQKSGSGRRGGYKEEWRREIARHIAVLSNTWITVFEMDAVQTDEKGRRKRIKWRGESRAVVVTSRMGQVRWDLEAQREILEVYAWRVRPGDVFAKFLFGPGRQTALLSQRALEYDPYRQKWEKRLTRYLSWQWRIRQGGSGCLEPVSVGKLLEAVGEAVDARNPSRTKERLEKALDTLLEDGVISGWQYEAAQEKTVGRRGWWKQWLNWKIIVEPPQDLIDRYARLPQAPAKALPPAEPADAANLGQRLREVRNARGLTLLQAAEEMGISPSRLSEIETGRKPAVSEDTRRKILKWLEKKEG